MSQAAFRRTFVTLNLAALSFAALWAYASHRYDGFNVGGQHGDVNFWIQMGNLGCYGTLVLWILCIAVSIRAAISGTLTSWAQRIAWILLALCGAPLVFFGLAVYLNPNLNLLH
ncbi:hypothetical protein [Noviluteimonas gilva]|uniref:Uncharacterized protein n=1 Tax=Noviluteimonas gilva TaxID=2682097 RepID=A0A7C9HNF5_9GAMM|nr:hypothetical protein [Lysobacter gilvus]MUV15275.1 hypothetical protein [Lysobacter gilvus]